MKKKRYLYSFLFGLPGFFVSLITAFAAFGMTTGFLWVFVYGDTVWPQATESALTTLFSLTFLLLWSAFIAAGFVYGSRCEDNAVLNKRHIWISVSATILPIGFIILHQSSVGNIAKASDSKLCSDFCSAKGYSASGIPPKNSAETNCSCYAGDGRENITVSMDAVINY